MRTKYRTKTQTSFTKDGEIGVWMFLLSPFAQGLSWWWMMVDPGIWPGAVIAATGLTFLGGCVLMLIGREQESVVEDLTQP